MRLLMLCTTLEILLGASILGGVAYLTYGVRHFLGVHTYREYDTFIGDLTRPFVELAAAPAGDEWPRAYYRRCGERGYPYYRYTLPEATADAITSRVQCVFDSVMDIEEARLKDITNAGLALGLYLIGLYGAMITFIGALGFIPVFYRCCASLRKVCCKTTDSEQSPKRRRWAKIALAALAVTIAISLLCAQFEAFAIVYACASCAALLFLEFHGPTRSFAAVLLWMHVPLALGATCVTAAAAVAAVVLRVLIEGPMGRHQLGRVRWMAPWSLAAGIALGAASLVLLLGAAAAASRAVSEAAGRADSCKDKGKATGGRWRSHAGAAAVCGALAAGAALARCALPRGVSRHDARWLLSPLTLWICVPFGVASVVLFLCAVVTSLKEKDEHKETDGEREGAEAGEDKSTAAALRGCVEPVVAKARAKIESVFNKVNTAQDKKKEEDKDTGGLVVNMYN